MVNDTDAWRAKQTKALTSDLVASITCMDPNFKTLACEVGLDPHVQQWVDSICPCLREMAIRMINQETIEDCLISHATEILETEWMCRQTNIKTQLQAKSEAYVAQLNEEAATYFETKKKALLDEANEHLHKFELDLDAKTADEIQQLKNKSRTTLQLAKDKSDSHTLSLAI
jgi:hypothetical protein